MDRAIETESGFEPSGSGWPIWALRIGFVLAITALQALWQWSWTRIASREIPVGDHSIRLHAGFSNFGLGISPVSPYRPIEGDYEGKPSNTDSHSLFDRLKMPPPPKSGSFGIFLPGHAYHDGVHVRFPIWFASHGILTLWIAAEIIRCQPGRRRSFTNF